TSSGPSAATRAPAAASEAGPSEAAPGTSMRTRLVTGAAGFAGQHLLRSLAGTPGPLIGWYRPGAPPPITAPTGVDWRPVDLRDPRAVDEALAEARPAEVYHLAGAANQGASWQQTDVALELNARATH